MWPILIYLLFGAFSTDTISDRLFQSLEDKFKPANLDSLEPADSAFVLGSMANPLASVNEQPQFTDGVDRLLTAIDLFNSKKVRYLILTGKSSMIAHSGLAESTQLKQYLIKHGFSAEHILIDDESRNTVENFKYGLTVAKEKNLQNHYLITSAFHLYRSMLIFETLKDKHEIDQNITMIPIPVDYRSNRTPPGIEGYVPSAHGIFKSSIALKEYIGLISYSINGYINYRRLLQDLL